jgi:hypothetical protein
MYSAQALVSIHGGPLPPLPFTRCSGIYFEKNGHIRFALFSGIIYTLGLKYTLPYSSLP